MNSILKKILKIDLICVGIILYSGGGTLGCCRAGRNDQSRLWETE